MVFTRSQVTESYAGSEENEGILPNIQLTFFLDTFFPKKINDKISPPNISEYYISSKCQNRRFVQLTIEVSEKLLRI